MKSTVFGPVNSRRFGRSLGIDLSPDQKSCNFDCLYCELPKAQRVETIPNPPSVSQILNDLSCVIQKGVEYDVLTITANGEPTLYPYLDTLIDHLLPLKNGAKLLLLSNGSTLTSPTLRKTLSRLDMVKLSLDCALEGCYKKIDRPLHINVKEVIESFSSFRQEFKGELILELLLVKGVNDTQENKHALREAFRKIHPDRIDIGTIDRPPAYDVLPVPYETIEEFATFFEGFPTFIPLRQTNNYKLPPLKTEEEVLELLSRRPLGIIEAINCYNDETVVCLETLVKSQKIFKRDIGSIEFYCIPT